MPDVAIHVEGLSKTYQLGQRRGYDTLRDVMASAAGSLFRRSAGESHRATISALDDVSFDVSPGEVIGVIGRNGAGKTTLLRILSRITEPSRGLAEIHGRLGSLLEVGTGFHPELTGRENIALNGAILGMRRTEVARKFDDIVAFAGVEAFVDTPVKRYSSGMYVRLAFSVAAHLEPEILLVDEVLAVGDSEFQKRCLGKMQEIGTTGRTVLFVSHSMPTVARLCDRVLLMERGRLAADGPTAEVISRYLRSEEGALARRTWPDPVTAPGDDVARIRTVRVVGESDGADAVEVDMRSPVAIEFTFDVLRAERAVTPMISVTNDQGIHVFNALDPSERWRGTVEPGSYTSVARVPGNFLNEGTHIVTVFVNAIASGAMVKHAVATDAVSFQVVNRGDASSAKGTFVQAWGGAVSPLLDWSTTGTRA